MADNYKYLGIGLSVLFGVAALLFFGVVYPYHLHYQEECQLFLFTRSYFSETVSRPGGLADYIGRFFTQFYYHAWCGAAILAVLLVVVQRLVWELAKKVRLRWAFYPLTFLPSIALWVSYCDPERRLSLYIACAACLLAFYLYLCIGNTVWRLLFGAVMMPVLYWSIGGAYVIFVGLVVLFEGLWAAEKRAWLRWCVIFAAGAALALFYPWAAGAWFSYPLSRLFLGIGYHRVPLRGLPAQFAVIILAAVVPFVFRFLPELKRKQVFYAVFSLELIIVAVGGCYAVWSNADMSKEEEFAYDYYVRMGNWEKVLEMADRKPPAGPMEVACVNLALAKTGQLGDKMFNYCQVGREGLFAEAEEVCYQLGMINSSQRFAFDLIQSATDFQNSARYVKRLAEANLINGQYKVAAKYLRYLQHTLFYRAWANETMALLDDENREDRINAHPEYGWLRQIREPKDYLWTFGPKFDDMQRALERLVRVNGKNRMAYEYLLACALLNKDLDRFRQCYPLGRDVRYECIPMAYQEALSIAWLKQHSSFEGMPWPIDRAVPQRLQRFVDACRRYPAAQLYGSFGDTYWYYLVFYAGEQKR